MILIVGKPGAGKAAWVQEQLGYAPEDFTCNPRGDAPVLADLQDHASELDIEKLEQLERFDVILCDEVGLGLIPIEADARIRRELVGRLCIELARRADAVVRVVEGQGTYIKGAPEQRLAIELYRHGATPGNARSAYIGITDEPLSDEGRVALHEVDPAETRVFVTSRLRTKQTASILFPRAEQVELPGLSEMDFGVFEGRNFEDLENDARYRSWVDAMCEPPCPGGEGIDVFRARCIADFQPVVDEALAAGEKRLRFVVHGGTIMALLERFAVPHRSYYEWRTGHGACWTLETTPTLWRRGILRVVGDIAAPTPAAAPATPALASAAAGAPDVPYDSHPEAVC